MFGHMMDNCTKKSRKEWRGKEPVPNQEVEPQVNGSESSNIEIPETVKLHYRLKLLLKTCRCTPPTEITLRNSFGTLVRDKG